jgi:hypothetical protein
LQPWNGEVEAEQGAEFFCGDRCAIHGLGDSLGFGNQYA